MIKIKFLFIIFLSSIVYNCYSYTNNLTNTCYNLNINSNQWNFVVDATNLTHQEKDMINGLANSSRESLLGSLMVNEIANSVRLLDQLREQNKKLKSSILTNDQDTVWVNEENRKSLIKKSRDLHLQSLTGYAFHLKIDENYIELGLRSDGIVMWRPLGGGDIDLNKLKINLNE